MLVTTPQGQGHVNSPGGLNNSLADSPFVDPILASRYPSARPQTATLNSHSKPVGVEWGHCQQEPELPWDTTRATFQYKDCLSMCMDSHCK